jgi:bifunctional NMN adenylyltransferase/nudix hydrolase
MDSNKKQYDTIVYIGRFHPFHNAHKATITRALELAEQVIVVIGGAFEPRTFKNPFTFEERRAMIQTSFPGLNLDKLCVVGLENSAYNDNLWAARVQDLVEMNAYAFFGPNKAKTGLIGYNKDATSYYLKLFPQWEFIEQPLVEILDATTIREMYFRESGVNFNWFKNVLPEPVQEFLVKFSKSKEYGQIIRERMFIEKYKSQFANLPYPPIFVTADAVVIQSGHVLVVKRRSEPGKGLYALPGGFVNAATDKSVLDASIRELIEETRIKVPEKVLRGSIKDNHVFDRIDRSDRGRTITHAFYILLEDIGELPKVKGADDAEKAFWMPLSKVNREEFFDDHKDIIDFFVGK